MPVLFQLSAFSFQLLGGVLDFFGEIAAALSV
jgi:hypothetical protein